MKFVKPKGAPSDLREMEYISALHQTGKSLRRDGSIDANDISLFLMSRYGISASPAEITETISHGFGGGSLNESDGDVMDLTEVMAMLLIPTLIREGRTLSPNDDTSPHGRDSLNKDELDRSAIVEDADDIFPHPQDMKQSPMIMTKPSSVSKGHSSSHGKSSLFHYVLQMILMDVTGTTTPPPITRDLLRNIFEFYGEKDVASNSDLLDQMVTLAAGGDHGCVLDGEVFGRCCTSDVELYDLEWEGMLTSTFVDVFGEEGSGRGRKRTAIKYFFGRWFGGRDKNVATIAAEKTGQEEEQEEERLNDVEVKDKVTRRVIKKNTLPSIDYAVDTFRSKTYVILLWFTWVLFYMNFIGVFGSTNSDLGDLNCDQYDIRGVGFPCSIGQGVISWLKIMFKLVVLGSVFIVGASVGHSTDSHNPLLVIVSMAFICLYTFVPLNVEADVLPSEDGLSHELSTKKVPDEYSDFLLAAATSVGVMLLFLCLQNILDRSIPVNFLNKHKVLQQVLASGTVFMERNMKQAANFKINRMIRNACEIHDVAAREHDSSGKDTAYGRALLTYSKVCDDTEEIGGYWWTWNGLRTGRLFDEEGIWLSNRVMQGNLGQLFLCLVLIPIMIQLDEELDFFYGFLNELFEIPVPDRWRIAVPLAVAFVLAELNSIALVAVYIPSTIRTTFRFRYGGLGSLHHDDFQKMRTQTEQASFIFGNMFWGCFISNVLVLVVTFCVVSVFCLPQFLPNLLRITSSFIGLGITIMIKQLFLMLVRTKFSGETFYRANPAVANFINVLLEAWNLGISVLFVFIRMVTLVITAFIYVARVDIPFLSDSADEIGGVLIDKWPFVFRKDMLQHEAHRHPYLERIGVMYMMKLRYGEKFGSQAGTSWRLLFVYALFPWLRRYRIRGDESSEEAKSTVEIQSKISTRQIGSITRDEKSVESLEKEIKKLKAEVSRLTACLEEARTEGIF